MSYKELKLLENMSLYDSSLKKIAIYNNDNIIEVEVILKLNYPHDIYIRLLFKEVIDYFFSWNKDFYFYIVESYKLLKTDDDIYYCSFDPFDRESSISEKDGDVIKSKSIEGYCSYNEQFTNSVKLHFE